MNATLVASIAAFAVGGGWLAARVAAALTQSHVSAPLMVVIAGVLGSWAAAVVFGRLALALSFGLGWTLLALAAVDYIEFRLPDLLTLPLIAAGIAAAYALPSEQPLDHAVAAVIAFLMFWGIGALYRRLRKQEGLGLGDAKLAAAAGAWLGTAPLPFTILIASLAGIVWVAVSMAIRGRAAARERIPFGIPLCVSLWIVWLYGAPAFAGAA